MLLSLVYILKYVIVSSMETVAGASGLVGLQGRGRVLQRAGVRLHCTKDHLETLPCERFTRKACRGENAVPLYGMS